ncbi:MAG TPA: hypothetical protein VFE45_18345 [Coriobacteriia bacterium]|nr:hypothetical protein [Coriobacteriia bacterium]
MTRYFTSSATGALLRTQDATGHTVFLDGRWVPTTTVMEYMIGEENSVDPITEAQARELAPAAFASGCLTWEVR